MKSRPQGFLSEENISHESEVFDYVSELHGYLWRLVRVARPGASGDLGNLLDSVIESLETAQQNAQSDRLYWCWKCNLWQKFDHDNRCGVCKTARR